MDSKDDFNSRLSPHDMLYTTYLKFESRVTNPKTLVQFLTFSKVVGFFDNKNRRTISSKDIFLVFVHS